MPLWETLPFLNHLHHPRFFNNIKNSNSLLHHSLHKPGGRVIIPFYFISDCYSCTNLESGPPAKNANVINAMKNVFIIPPLLVQFYFTALKIELKINATTYFWNDIKLLL